MGSANSSPDRGRCTPVMPLEDYKIVNEVKKDVVVYLCRKKIVLHFKATSHWSLFFYVKDSDFYIVYEAGEENGSLTPSRRICDSLPRKEGTVDKLGTLTTSLAELHRAALANRLNKTPYNAMLNNCQDWAYDLCSKLGIQEELRDVSDVTTALKAVGLSTMMGFSVAGPFGAFVGALYGTFVGLNLIELAKK